MDKVTLIKRIQNLTQPISPIPTEHPVRLSRLDGIQCVAFDFYGTMFISGVGDIGVDEDRESDSSVYFVEALTDSGFKAINPDVHISGPRIFQRVINEYIASKKESGIEFPEPDIIKIWLDVLNKLSKQSLIKGDISKENATRFAIEFEFRVNSIWPVPDLNQILKKLKNHKLKLGIISNSQFYTPLAFEAIMGKPPEAFGFTPDLMKWSYVSGLKKPSIHFYELFTNALKTMDFGPKEVLYIGNDVHKDISPAKKLGMKTGLYVGDNRSIRHSSSDLEQAAFIPDIIINDLDQINQCLT